MNDTLRGDFDVVALGRTLTETIAALTASGAAVLTPPGSRTRAGCSDCPGCSPDRSGGGMAALNTVFDGIAASHGTIHVDLAGSSDDNTVYARTNWSIDRLHPSERGHRLLA